MEKKLHKTLNKVKTVLHNPKAVNSKKPKKATYIAHYSDTGQDPDELVHTQPAAKPGTTSERDADNIVHDKLDYLPEAEDDNEYFEDDDLSDLVSDR